LRGKRGEEIETRRMADMSSFGGAPIYPGFEIWSTRFNVMDEFCLDQEANGSGGV
jgi:hypothetical protein